jgi:thiol-disulfide isomerase/thioredoxin
MKRISKIIVSALFIISSFGGSAQEIPKWKIADLEAAIKESTKPTIINFWASFCKPCIAEIPYFQKTVAAYKSDSVQLILVSLDMNETYSKLPVFIKKFGIDKSAVVFLDETNADLFCPVADPKWSGAIPASLFINNKTGYRKFFEDGITEGQFGKEVKLLVGK